MLYEGANLSQLGILFKMDHRVLVQKLHGLQPVGERRGAALYDIAEAAGRLWRPTEEEVDAAVKRMNHTDLPKQLTKEFWSGLRTKQEFQREAGELWSTTEVTEKVGELFKILKIQLQLVKDSVERTTELSERQRKLIIGMMNGTLTDIQKAIIEQFSDNVELSDGQEEEDDDL